MIDTATMCDFCEKVTKVFLSDKPNLAGCVTICEACADAAICDFLGDRDESEEDDDEG